MTNPISLLKITDEHENILGEFNFNGAIGEYFSWNIENSALAFVSRPKEYDVNMAVYQCHRSALKDLGIHEEELQRGDDKLVERITELVTEANRRTAYKQN